MKKYFRTKDNKVCEVSENLAEESVKLAMTEKEEKKLKKILREAGLFFEKSDKHKSSLEKLIEKAKEGLKHPHFYYAVVDTKTETIEYKRKKWYQCFSGQKTIYVKSYQFVFPGTFGIWREENDKRKIR